MCICVSCILIIYKTGNFFNVYDLLMVHVCWGVDSLGEVFEMSSPREPTEPPTIKGIIPGHARFCLPPSLRAVSSSRRGSVLRQWAIRRRMVTHNDLYAIGQWFKPHQEWRHSRPLGGCFIVCPQMAHCLETLPFREPYTTLRGGGTQNPSTTQWQYLLLLGFQLPDGWHFKDFPEGVGPLNNVYSWMLKQCLVKN